MMRMFQSMPALLARQHAASAESMPWGKDPPPHSAAHLLQPRVHALQAGPEASRQGGRLADVHAQLPRQRVDAHAVQQAVGKALGVGAPLRGHVAWERKRERGVRASRIAAFEAFRWLQRQQVRRLQQVASRKRRDEMRYCHDNCCQMVNASCSAS